MKRLLVVVSVFFELASWSAGLFAFEAVHIEPYDIKKYDVLENINKDQFDQFKGLQATNPDVYKAFDDYRKDPEKSETKLDALIRGEPDLARLGRDTLSAFGELDNNQIEYIRQVDFDEIKSTIPQWKEDTIEKKIDEVFGDQKAAKEDALGTAIKYDSSTSMWRNLDYEKLEELSAFMDKNPTTAELAQKVIALSAKEVSGEGETVHPTTAQDYITSFVDALAKLEEVSPAAIKTTIEPLLPKQDAAEMRISVIEALVDDLKPGGQILSGAPKTQGMVRSELARQLALTDLSKITNIDDRITALKDMNNLAKDFSRDIATGEKLSDRQLVRDAALKNLVETIGDTDVISLDTPLSELSSQLKRFTTIDQGKASLVLNALAERLEDRILGRSDLTEAKGFGTVLEAWKTTLGEKSDAYSKLRDAMRDRLFDLFKLDSDVRAEDIKGIDLASSTFQTMLSLYFSDSRALINRSLARRIAQLPLDPYLKVVRGAFEKIATTKTDTAAAWSDADKAEFVKELEVQLPKDSPALRVDALVQYADQLKREATTSGASIKVQKGHADALIMIAQEIAKTDLSKVTKADERIAILKNMSYAIAVPFEYGLGKSEIQAALQKNLVDTSELMKTQKVAALDRLEKWKEAIVGVDGLTNVVTDLRKQVKAGSAIAEDIAALDESSKPADRMLALLSNDAVKLPPNEKKVLWADNVEVATYASDTATSEIMSKTIENMADVEKASSYEQFNDTMAKKSDVISAAQALANAKLTLWEKTKLKAVDVWNSVVDAFSRVTVGLRLKMSGYTHFNAEGTSAVGDDAANIIKAKSLGERKVFLNQVQSTLAKTSLSDDTWTTLKTDFVAKQKAAEDSVADFYKKFELNPADTDFYSQVTKRLQIMTDIQNGQFQGLTNEQRSRAFKDWGLPDALQKLVKARQAVIDAGGNVLNAVANDLIGQAVTAASSAVQ